MGSSGRRVGREVDALWPRSIKPLAAAARTDPNSLSSDKARRDRVGTDSSFLAESIVHVLSVVLL